MNDLVTGFNAGTLTMSSNDIADLTGKEHKNVLADIRKMLSELGVSPTDFSAVYKDQQLISRPCFNLPKRETLILVSGYSIEMRAKIIDRWQELESRGVVGTDTQHRLPAAVAAEHIKAELELAALFSVPLHLAQAEAVKTVKATIGYDAARFLLLAPAQTNIPVDEMRLEPTELGKMFGMSAIKVNRALEEAGLQKKVALGWEPTGEGKLYASSHQWVSGSKSGYNLKWAVSKARSVLETVKS